MAKIMRRNGFYLIRSPCPKSEFDEDIGDWCGENRVTIQHSNPSGSLISIEDCLATDARLSFLFKAVCEIESLRG
jgi:hypothetical protein